MVAPKRVFEEVVGVSGANVIWYLVGSLVAIVTVLYAVGLWQLLQWHGKAIHRSPEATHMVVATACFATVGLLMADGSLLLSGVALYLA